MNEIIIAITKHKDINISNFTLIHQNPESNIPKNCQLILVDESSLQANYSLPTLVIIKDLDKIDLLLKRNIHNFIIYPFTQKELESRIYIAINQFYNEKNIRDITYLDDLTELYNKKFLYTKLEELINDNCSFSVIMIDIDNFRALNLSCGHIKCDMFLKEFSTAMKSCLRNIDLVFRFGGEEFVIILKDVDYQVAQNVNQRLFRTLQKSDLPFTISCGITTKMVGDSEKSILERADKALIRAKKEGKNRFYLI